MEMAEIVDLNLKKTEVNLELLHQELKQAFGDQVAGVSTTGEPGEVRVHIHADMTEEQQAEIRQLVEAHDAKKLTPVQQKAQNWKTALQALKKPWAQWSDADRLTLIRYLAEQAGLLPSD